MTSATSEEGEPEVLGGLSKRAKRRFDRPGRLRLTLVMAGGFSLAFAATLALMITGHFDPKIPRHLGYGGAFAFAIAFWPTTLMWFAFGVALDPISRRLFRNVEAVPVPETATTLTEYLGITIVDEENNGPSKPKEDEHDQAKP